MKAFLAAIGMFALGLGLSALIYSALATSTSAAFSTQHVRIGEIAAPEGWLAWASEPEEL